MLLKLKTALRLLEKADRVSLIFFTIARSFLGVLDIVGILIIGTLITKSTESLIQSSPSSSPISNLLKFAKDLTFIQLGLLALLIFVGKSILAITFTKIMTANLAKSETKIAKSLFSKILNSNLPEISASSKTELIYSLTLAPNYAITSLLSLAVTFLSETILLIAIISFFAIVNLKITLIIAIYFFIVGLLIYWAMGSRLHAAGNQYAKSASASGAMVDASLLAFREVSVLGKEINFVNQFGLSSSKLSKASATIGFLNSLPRYIVESALIVGTLLLGAYTFSSQDVSSATGILAVFMTGSLRIMASMIPLQNSIGAIRELGAKSEPFYELVERFSNKSELNNCKDKNFNNSAFPLSVEFNEVSFRYKSESDLVVTQLSFKIDSGSMVAIIGPSGSGKSTVADLIAGLIKPVSGTVHVGDQVNNSTFVGIGYVPQRPGIFNGSILQNITLNFEEDEFNKDQLQFALEEASLKDLINNLPDGLSTNLGSQSDQLSGGQLQRIGLARALYAKPRLLLLDEATSALDPETEFVISNSIEKLRKDCTVIVIAHRMATIQKADNILVVDDGKLVAEGKFSKLAQSNELLSRYIELSEISLD